MSRKNETTKNRESAMEENGKGRMIYDDKLLDLLERWEKLREEGTPVSVEQLCADCPEFRDRVEQALLKRRRVSTLVGQLKREGTPCPAGPSLTTDLPAADGRRFQVLRPHRAGGLGEVLVAYDGEFDREVALKRIQKAHAADADSRRRFLFEAKITGHLEHPGIVPVYSLVQQEEGPPSYVMRLVRGETLKEAIESFHRGPGLARPAGARSLAFRQLLNRFLTVCQTVAYAHSRGIVHRDLKPANVILGKYGETMVVDWGLAKSVVRDQSSVVSGESSGASSEGPRVGEDMDYGLRTMDYGPGTQPGQVIGTPQYMSPEQAAGRAEQLGPASDIYSLGATLYCLLTGTAPFPDPGEMSLQSVLEQVQHGTFRHPRQIEKGIPRALEAICLRAMALRPEDRYASAQALTDDLERWLADEPVTAYREPRRTRAARWLRRHKTLGTSAVVLAATALLALLIGTALLARAKAKAQTAEATTNAINQFLTQDLLAAVRPGELGREVTMRQALDAAAAKLDGAFAGQPEVEAAVRQTIGRTYQLLGRYPEGEPHLRRAVDLCRDCFGVEHPRTLNAANELASLFLQDGRLADAEPLFRQGAESYRRILGPDHPDTLAADNNLARVLQDQGRYAEAESLHRQNVEARRRVSGPDDPESLKAVDNLAVSLIAQGKLPEAERLLRQNLSDRSRVLGSDHPDTLTSVNNLAHALSDQGKFSEAEPLLRQNLEARSRVFGPDHAETLRAVSSLGALLWAQDRLSEAEPLQRRHLEQCRQLLRQDHPDTLQSINNLGMVLWRQGKRAEAEPLLRESLEARRRVSGPDHPDTLGAVQNLALLLHQQGNLTDAELLFREYLQWRGRVSGADHPETVSALNNLGIALLEQNKYAEAEAVLCKALDARRRVLGPNNPHTLYVAHSLAFALEDQGKLPEAEALCREILSRRQTLADYPELLARIEGTLGAVLTRSGRAQEAEPLLRKDLEWRRKGLPQGQRWIDYAESRLGDCLRAQARYPEAEPMLLNSYQALKTAQGVSPTNLCRAAERVIQLYEAWGKPERAAPWRVERDQLPKSTEEPQDR